MKRLSLVMAMTALTLCIMAQEITISRDVRYREGESNSWVLDIARPKAATQRPARLGDLHRGRQARCGIRQRSGRLRQHKEDPSSICQPAQWRTHGYIRTTIWRNICTSGTQVDGMADEGKNRECSILHTIHPRQDGRMGNQGKELQMTK